MSMELWDKLKTPPAKAMKKIVGGRLRGMTDISPQWRYKIMTEVFGACGSGWKFTIEELWKEDGSDDQVFAFARVNIQYKQGDVWSEPIQGIGGSMLVAKEKAGLYSSDEGYKMAVTDALGTAMKMIGVAAEVYENVDFSARKPDPEPEMIPAPNKAQQTFIEETTNGLIDIASENGRVPDMSLVQKLLYKIGRSGNKPENYPSNMESLSPMIKYIAGKPSYLEMATRKIN